MKIHKTRPVQVWIDVDERIATIVEVLNREDGVRTYASCQGTIGEGGESPYVGYVLISWDSQKTLTRLLKKFAIQSIGNADSNEGYVLVDGWPEDDNLLPYPRNVKP
jgi:hypothetical protein